MSDKNTEMNDDKLVNSQDKQNDSVLEKKPKPASTKTEKKPKPASTKTEKKPKPASTKTKKKPKPASTKTKKKRGSSDLVVKDALLLRKKISKTRPKFQRQESWRYDRIKINWRKPKGFDSKMRIQKKGWPAIVKIGYRGPKSARGLHPSGFYDKLIYNIDELNILNPETDAIRISSKIGKRYKLTIVNKAEKLGFHILNPHINNKRKR